jgi:hypothetical protein
VFAHACKMGLEGIVSKRKDSPYRSGRCPDWLKSKNPACAAVKREAEEDGDGAVKTDGKPKGDAMPKKLQNGILFQGENMFVIRDGKRIAKRNQQTKTWIPLEPGWQVFDADDGYTMEIVYQGVRVQ